MSSQKGNMKKKQQKYQNSMAFRNDMHDTSHQTKALNKMTVGGVCTRCKEQIEWKIKFKKYKPLKQPKKCTRCEERSICKAYYILCKPCAAAANVCAKCGKNEEIVTEHGLSPDEEASQASNLEGELRYLSERQRRSFFRSQEKGGHDGGSAKEARSISKEQELDDEDEEDEESQDERTTDS
ncbi:uncharacterized protein C9orf85 homolog [Asterias rubens]|uniref:uncharacterized protein C9orf85 homolog n=1 Tax=Asterias rubens TaxID=7604 RepID=UPI00145514C9|nr:uncharacterized protein C9orf85 homolog [Asterias rubens]